MIYRKKLSDTAPLSIDIELLAFHIGEVRCFFLREIVEAMENIDKGGNKNIVKEIGKKYEKEYLANRVASLESEDFKKLLDILREKAKPKQRFLERHPDEII